MHDLCVESSVVEVAKRIILQKFLLNCGTKCSRILRGRNFAVHDLGRGKLEDNIEVIRDGRSRLL
jgi:hypothetical protein